MLNPSPLSLLFLGVLGDSYLHFVFTLAILAAAGQLRRGGHTGAFRGIRRMQPSLHAANSANSAALRELPARQFSGK